MTEPESAVALARAILAGWCIPNDWDVEVEVLTLARLVIAEHEARPGDER